MSTLVAIGFAEALAAPEVTWSLIDAGYQVIGFTRKRRRPPALSRSRYVTLFEITPPEESWGEAREDLARLLAQPSYDAFDERVLLPLDDAALWLTSEGSFAKRWYLAGPTGANARFALQKSQQLEVATRAGFSVPPSQIVTSRDELESAVAEFPIILRSAEAASFSASYNKKGSNWICADRHELRRAMMSWDESYPLLLQPYYQGTGEGIFGFSTGDEIVGLSGHRRLRMMNPHGSGSSACQAQSISDDVRKCCEAFVRFSGSRGMFMIETLRDKNNESWFIEFNGRAWGSMSLARRQGLEYPAWQVQTALGQTVSDHSIPGCVLTSRNLGREIMHLLFVARGPQTRALAWPSFWHSLRDLLSVRGRQRFYNWRRSDWKVFFYDTWATLRDQLFKS